MQFSEIPGLESRKNVLVQSVGKNHVAHAQLFHGPEGSASLPLAVAFATYLNCTNRTETDSCGECPSCSKMAKLAHPDVTYLFPTAGGKKVLSQDFMEDWRAFVKETPYGNITDWLMRINIKQGNFPVEEARQLVSQLSLKSYEGGYKVVLIWRVEYFNNATANALLKLLEEPPEKTIFLMTCEHSDLLLTTIISRTQRFAVPAFSNEELEKYLEEKKSIELTRAKEISKLAEGNLRKAINLISSGTDNNHPWFAQWMRYTYAFDLAKLVSLADEFDSFPKEQQKNLLSYALFIFRQIFLTASGNDSLVRLEGETLEFVKKFALAFKFQSLPEVQGLVDEAIFHIERNVRSKVVFLDISLRIARIIK